eukprot:3024146-Rhodomonas_salina.1
MGLTQFDFTVAVSCSRLSSRLACFCARSAQPSNTAIAARARSGSLSAYACLRMVYASDVRSYRDVPK